MRLKEAREGVRAGRLRVVQVFKVPGERDWRALCRCDCGVLCSPRLDSVGVVANSCGCLSREIAGERLRSMPEIQRKAVEAARKNKITTHGYARRNGSTRKLYDTARNMKRRCELPYFAHYHLYGGRGIEFRFPDVVACIEYIAQLPNAGEPGMSIDRIDVNGHYEPGNLRWATAKEQIANRRPRTLAL